MSRNIFKAISRLYFKIKRTKTSIDTFREREIERERENLGYRDTS